MTSPSNPSIEKITNALLDLSPASSASSFACRLNLPAESLSLSVTGVGKIRLPVTPNRAKTLIKVARQAPFGRREKTLTNLTVRDAWEIAKSRVRIDNRVWNQALNPALKQIGKKLGLEHGELKADLYKMLVYQPGQFFVPHRDSEKDDNMLATLVVVLPSAHRGGVLVIEHQDSSKKFYSHQTTADKVSLFAFYADCRHELKPVTEGYRIALTYNVSYKAAAPQARSTAKARSTVKTRNTIAQTGSKTVSTKLQNALGHYLSDPAQLQPLVVLLDHQYSDKSLRMANLKNADRVRAQALKMALNAEYPNGDYHLNLALLSLDETWHASGDNFDPYDGFRGHYGYDDDDFDEEPEEHDSQDHEQLTLHELIEQRAELRHWRDTKDKRQPLDSLFMYDIPLVSCININKLKPASSYYEDYTGNAGNTLDRTYHLAAIVIWTQRAHIGVLAKISLHHVFDYLLSTHVGKSATDCVTALNSLDAEKQLRRYESDTVLLVKLIKLLRICDNKKLCRKYLEPLSLTVLTPKSFKNFTQLAGHYGDDFLYSILQHWTGSDWKHHGWFKWINHLERFIEFGKNNSDLALSGTTNMLFDRFNDYFKNSIDNQSASALDDFFDDEYDEIQGNSTGQNLTVLLRSSILLGDAKRSSDLQGYILQSSDKFNSADLVFTLEKLVKHYDSIEGFYKKLYKLLEKRLQSEADNHVRAANDWRISHHIKCSCDYCSQLKPFLESPVRQKLDIRAAKAKRMHLHRTIDAGKLPVSHTTTRSGSPFTLNLVKRKALFSQEKMLRKAKLRLLDKLNHCPG